MVGKKVMTLVLKLPDNSLDKYVADNVIPVHDMRITKLHENNFIYVHHMSFI